MRHDLHLCRVVKHRSTLCIALHVTVLVACCAIGHDSNHIRHTQLYVINARGIGKHRRDLQLGELPCLSNVLGLELHHSMRSAAATNSFTSAAGESNTCVIHLIERRTSHGWYPLRRAVMGALHQRAPKPRHKALKTITHDNHGSCARSQSAACENDVSAAIIYL